MLRYILAFLRQNLHRFLYFDPEIYLKSCSFFVKNGIF